MQLETISSISTPVGEGAIAIVRLSGVDAVEIADRLYKGAKPLEAVDSHTINYGHILDPDTGETVEEVMVAIMRAPAPTRARISLKSIAMVVSIRSTGCSS